MLSLVPSGSPLSALSAGSSRLADACPVGLFACLLCRTIRLSCVGRFVYLARRTVHLPCLAGRLPLELGVLQPPLDSDALSRAIELPRCSPLVFLLLSALRFAVLPLPFKRVATGAEHRFVSLFQNGRAVSGGGESICLPVEAQSNAPVGQSDRLLAPPLGQEADLFSRQIVPGETGGRRRKKRKKCKLSRNIGRRRRRGIGCEGDPRPGWAG